MKKYFILKAVIFPLAAAVILGAFCFFVISSNVDSIVPYERGCEVLSFDDTRLSDEMISADDYAGETSLRKNDLIGSFENLDLRYNADYSVLNSSASLVDHGVLPSEDGCSYIRLGARNALEAGKTVSVEDVLGNTKYKLEKEKTVSNENEVFSIAPSCKNSLVVYYSDADGVGLTSRFRVMIYKEVE
ncbi:MAG: hypothetical protein IJT65_06255 [Eubacterium sp.]|nr:hypothetical protein [Eubacterium sp.]